MKLIKHIGMVIFLVGLALFTGLSFVGTYEFDQQVYDVLDDNTKDQIGQRILSEVVGNTYSSGYAATNAVLDIAEQHNQDAVARQDWNNRVFNADHKNPGLNIARRAIVSPVKTHKGLWLFLTFGLGIIGGLLFIVPNVVIQGVAGIKNDDIYHDASTSQGWIGWLTLVYLVGFYIVLYFFPDLMVNQVLITDPVKAFIVGPGNEGSQWFLYGMLYCTVMTVMGIRMIIKYRHNRYQVVRTLSVLFFQIAFAFLIPEIMSKFNLPYMDLKNAWPLDYDFFFDYNIKGLIESGNIGLFMLVWGIVLTLIVVPILVYIYGKRWYCSWVCGCGGLAETLGDPYRQHSDKSLKAWKLERYIIHIVLVFAVVMTIGTLYTFLHKNPEGYWLTTGSLVGIVSFLTIGIGVIILYGKGHLQDFTKSQRRGVAGLGGVILLLTLTTFFMGGENVFFLSSDGMRSNYGFLIGSIFSGVIGTGFYPIFGNRVWCRFGCPLAAYMGLVQRFKSRFRITTNGGQCISCGNCSTYCEQGIDVRAYAQKGENIVRSSCVGCGVCSAVCPRGVLKLENGPEEGRIVSNPIILGSDGATIDPELLK